MKKILQLLTHRITLIITLMLFQLAIFVGIVIFFNNYFIYFYALNIFLSILVTFNIIYSKSNSAYRIAWLIPVLILPIFGTLLYLLFGIVYISKSEKTKLETINRKYKEALPSNNLIDQIEKENKDAAAQAKYIYKYADTPIYDNTESKYYKSGEEVFPVILENLRNAKKYIFIEYFILNSSSSMWQEILEILKDKVKEGLDIRVIYDDIGSMFALPYKYNNELNKLGIKCMIFNPFIPVLSPKFNNRSHRKSLIIDGEIAYTGGINIADEYINRIERFGYWKDTVIELIGDASWAMSVSFLTIWDYLTHERDDYNYYKPKRKLMKQATGYCQPFLDTPFDDEFVSENIFLNLISKAKDYIYITTPYLIIDNELQQALSNAAKAGIKVIIATPHIPDKWYIFAVTRAYYEQLLECEVEIYEYTPGFLHAKSIVVDDLYGYVGSVNLDYRSLFLHFENGVWLYKTNSILEIKEDFKDIIKVSQQITLEDAQNVVWYRKLGRTILRVFSPLM
ncbi:cardiolipin synthase [Erysipelotrichaceae bacterium OttesenSCG-928-M19]|nr:cardiolipin synthase [Erysipelotrichaceae bacterium OttesenSCG-928-M19]